MSQHRDAGCDYGSGRDAGLSAQSTVHNDVVPSRERPVVQILTRGAPYDYATARTWAQDIWVALGSIRNQTLSGTFYLGVQPIQSVFKLRDDDYARPIMTCQFRCEKAV